MSRRSVVALSFAALAAWGAGCQRGPSFEFAPVEGTVTRGGKPLANVWVEFYTDPEAGTKGPRSMGATDAAGRYALRSDTGEVGAAVGKHRVCLVDSLTAAREAAAEYKARTAANDRPEAAKADEVLRAPAGGVPKSYGRFEETPLRVEVPSGGRRLDFEVP